MSKSTQNFRLYNLLKASTVVRKETVANELDVALNSVPVYIHGLKKLYKLQIDTVKEGRNVVAYQLVGGSSQSVPEFRRNAAGTKPKKVKKGTVQATNGKTLSATGEVPIPDRDLNSTYSERELADLSSSLGIDTTRNAGKDF